MTSPVTRRAALGTAAGAGLAGVLGALAGPAGSASASTAPPVALPAVLTTAGSVTGGPRGVQRTPGQTLAHRVALHDATGAVAGELVVSATVLTGRGSADALAAVHHHLLRLPGGTVAAHGTVDLAGRGEFVVVGGTGRHHGATGGYVLQPGPGSGATLIPLDPTTLTPELES